MEADEIIWQGKVGSVPLRVAVPHAAMIIAEWDAPQGMRHKVTNSLEEFERAVLFQLLLSAGGDESATQEIVEAVKKVQAERPAPVQQDSPRRRKNPKARQHRRSRMPPRRR